MGGGTLRGEPLRFINDVALQHIGHDCLFWPFGRGRDGYGRVWDGEKTTIASRYVCELAHGAPPTPKHDAAHSCGKGHEGCIAPGHLEWKTPTQNQADRIIHGTHSRGERNVRAKITDDEAREILALKGVEPQSALVKRFGVSQTTVSKIQCGKSWPWLFDEAVA
ncbi:hypothetical protein [Rhizobium laguerreae]|uniref:HNH endonuclease n=1 Tax=Rhizobium laguerreae TaxID=1076926 RepID=A0A7Y2RB76_9HYPH|nr:hypothetical protein [Rhizobium laguerreae]NNH67785.1 hypothetical protein [Rhizobium laguerreae]